MKLLLFSLVCVIGLVLGGGGGIPLYGEGFDGSAGPHGGNSYARKTYGNKGQADHNKQAKYNNNLHRARNHADTVHLAQKNFKNGAHKNYLNKYDAAAKKNRFNKKLALNDIDSGKKHVAFKKFRNHDKDLYNNIKYRNNLKDAHTNAATNVFGNKSHGKNANMKKLNSHANHNEYTNAADNDMGSGGSHGSGGARHASLRKHGQKHNFDNDVLKSNYNAWAEDNYGKKNHLNQATKKRDIGFGKETALKNHNNDGINYAAANNHYRKRNRLNLVDSANQNAFISKKNRANANNYKQANEALKNRNHRNSDYLKKRNLGYAANNAHSYHNQNANQKGIGNYLD